MTPLNLKKLTTVLTLCAVTMTCSAAPVLAADDTAFVGQTTPNLAAAAQAMAAANQQMNGASKPDVEDATNGDTESRGVDYVSLANPAQSIDGKTYLPLRATLEAMKDQALVAEWKPNGQQKVKLTGDAAVYEVYLNADGTALQLKKDGTAYTIKNVDGTTYVSIDFIQAIIPNNTISLSGNDILVLAAKNGSNVWNNLWGNMNTYKEETVAPEEPTVPEQPSTPDVEIPDVSYPDTNTPDTPSDDTTTDNNQGATGGISSGTAAAIIANAKQYLGVPYVWGGTTPAGFDCSGLVQYVFAANGISLPRTTYEQQAVVTPVSLDALQPGDLVFWGASAYHVGIYIGDGQYIHAPAPGQSVCIQSYSAYPYTSAGRVLA